MKLWANPVVIAHRGSRLLWPENTMAAFAGAIAAGARHVETDLRMSSDGALVCFHDRTVDRTTNGRGEVASLSWDEISQLDAGYRHGSADGFTFRNQAVEVPRFEELVTTFPEVGVIAELKADGMELELWNLIETHGLHDRVIVGSFSDTRLAEFRRVSKGTVRTSTGMAETRRWLVGARSGRPPKGDAKALQVPTHSRGIRVVDERLIAIAHQAGLDVHVWTVNRTEEMKRLLALGVDGLVTDRPDLLVDLLAEGL